MAVYGYARVSTTDQDLTVQEAALKAAGCDVIRAEKVSGTSRQGREELDTLMQFLRPGDTLVVTRIDRLARSVALQQRDKGLPLAGIAHALALLQGVTSCGIQQHGAIGKPPVAVARAANAAHGAFAEAIG